MHSCVVSCERCAYVKTVYTLTFIHIYGECIDNDRSDVNYWQELNLADC